MFDLIDVKILNTAIERRLNQEMSALDLTFTQTSVIAFLRRNPDKEICQRDVEINLGLTHPTVSSVLKRLEEKGMILTRPFANDKRFKQIMLTDKSLAVSDTINQKVEKLLTQALQGISTDEETALCAIMTRMLHNLSE